MTENERVALRLELMSRDPADLADKIVALGDELDDAFTVCPVRWALVRVGDVILTDQGALWMVLDVPAVLDRLHALVVHDGVGRSEIHTTDPDRPVPVLVRHREHLARRELNFTVTDGTINTTGSGS